MLIVNRRIGDGILIGDEVEIQIKDLKRRSVTLAIAAPKEVAISSRKLGTHLNGSRLAPRPGQRAQRGPERDDRVVSRSLRRVVIEPGPDAKSRAKDGIGARMLAQAIEECEPEVLDALARGDALNQPIRRALMELAREQLSGRRQAGAGGRR